MKKYSQHNRVIIFQAIVITVLFHVALFYTFIYKKTKIPTVKHGKQIVMLNMTNNESQQAQEMANWLKLHDPSLIAQPNDIYGYGSVSKRQKLRNPIQEVPVKIRSKLMMPRPFNFEFLSGKKELTIDKNSRLVDYETLPVPLRRFADSPLIPKRSYPLLKLSTGKYIDGILTGKELKQYKIPSGAKTGITKLQIIRGDAGIMPRIVVKKSCGTPELDQLAVRKLMLNQDKLMTKSLNNNPILFANIIWFEVKQ